MYILLQAVALIYWYPTLLDQAGIIQFTDVQHELSKGKNADQTISVLI